MGALNPHGSSPWCQAWWAPLNMGTHLLWLPPTLQLSLALHCMDLKFILPKSCLYPGEHCFLRRELGWHLWHLLGVSCWWWGLSQLMQCVSAARPFWVTNPRLDIQDANPSLQDLCQPDTWSFFFLRLWSGFVVVWKLFSQHSFPARQQSSYWDQSVRKERKCNAAFIWKFYIHLCVLLQGGKPPKVQLEQPPSSAVPIGILGAALTPVPVPRPLRQGPLRNREELPLQFTRP